MNICGVPLITLHSIADVCGSDDRDVCVWCSDSGISKFGDRSGGGLGSSCCLRYCLGSKDLGWSI
jgi:hypothetical protein